MILTCTRDSKWQVGGSIVEFKLHQDLTVGEDVSDKIAEDMLRCDYAIPKQGKTIEIKKAVKEKPKDKPKEVSDMSVKELVEFVKDRDLGIELDRTKSVKTLQKEVMKAMKENK